MSGSVQLQFASNGKVIQGKIKFVDHYYLGYFRMGYCTCLYGLLRGVVGYKFVTPLQYFLCNNIC